VLVLKAILLVEVTNIVDRRGSARVPDFAHFTRRSVALWPRGSPPGGGSIRCERRSKEGHAMANNVERLSRLGQSIWLDYIERRMLTSGELDTRIGEGLLGMTSNPTIFEKAIGGSDDYDAALRRVARSGASAERIADSLFVEDVGSAADRFRGVFERTAGADGFVSIEVSPRLAHDAEATLADARRLWKTLGRPNVMIKIPATREGIPVIEQALAEGINVNVTLMFSMAHYEAVAEAYLRAVERRVRAGQPVDRLASVASFFVSRVDVMLDAELAALAKKGGSGAPRAAALQGKAAIANSKLVYRRYDELFGGARFAPLAERGARRQRVLWASTSTKNPAYPDTLYVDTLIGPGTVNTVPLETWAAILDHARVERSVDADVEGSARVVSELASLGFDLDAVGERLSDEGVAKFSKSYDDLLSVIEDKRRKLAS
jgi:transaldolase